MIIDTSVFIQDALSRTRTGAAWQVLVALPTLATIVLCTDIRDELVDKLVTKFHWTERNVIDTYGPVLDAAVWVTPVGADHTQSSWSTSLAEIVGFAAGAACVWLGVRRHSLSMWQSGSQGCGKVVFNDAAEW